MRTKDFLTWREQVVVAYSSPTVDVLNLRAEGVLCGSYDSPGVGYDDENDLGEI
jgi:hypothetical protein